MNYKTACANEFGDMIQLTFMALKKKITPEINIRSKELVVLVKCETTGNLLVIIGSTLTMKKGTKRLK